MDPRLSGQNCKFFKLLLSLNSQKRLGYKENNTKYRILTRKPRSHVRILIYRTWPILPRLFWPFPSLSTACHAGYLYIGVGALVRILKAFNSPISHDCFFPQKRSPGKKEKLTFAVIKWMPPGTFTCHNPMMTYGNWAHYCFRIINTLLTD